MILRTESVGRKPILDAIARFGVLCLLGYVAVAWAVRFDTEDGPQNASIVYPFDTFSMYAGLARPTVSRVLVRDREGIVEPASAWRAFACTEPAAALRERCATRAGYVRYLDDDVQHYLASHPGVGNEPVDLVRRTWNIPADGPVRVTDDCVIATCRARR